MSQAKPRQKLALRKFSMDKIKFEKWSHPNHEGKLGANGPTIVLIGKRNTGKSVLVKDILYHHRDIPVGTVISGTEEVNGFYGQIVPKIFIHYEYSSFFIEKVLQRQKTMEKTLRMEAQQYGRINNDPRTFVILDDCLYNNRIWSNDIMMSYLFMNGRHLHIMLLITMQYPLGIPPKLRTNIDYVFILKTPIIKDRQRIYDHYAGMFPTFEVFSQTMDECTKNYECLVIDNTTQSNEISDMVFWYKADPNHGDFKMGNRRFWEYSKNMTDEDDSQEQPLTSTRRKNNQPSLNVYKLN